MLKFKIKARVIDIQALYKILPVNKLLTCSLPSKTEGLVNASFTSTICMEELKKIIREISNGSDMMESITLNYD